MEFGCDKMKPHSTKPCVHYVDGYKGEVGFCSIDNEFRCVEELKHRATILSHSAVQDFIACKMKFWYRYVKGINPKKRSVSTAMKMGVLWDIMQGIHYGCKTYADAEKYTTEADIYPDAVAKVEAMYRAYEKLIDKNEDGLVSLQDECVWRIGDEVIVHGYLDRSYEDYFVENKFSARPSNYTEDPFKISSQVGTYFLCRPKFKYVIMEVAKAPGLRRKDMEGIEEYEDRIYSDILSRPSFYFTGYDRNKRSYGIKFNRTDFEPFIEDAARRYKHITEEIAWTAERNAWYRTESSCMLYNSECPYLGICKNGMGYASERKYDFRGKKQRG